MTKVLKGVAFLLCLQKSIECTGFQFTPVKHLVPRPSCSRPLSSASPLCRHFRSPLSMDSLNSPSANITTITPLSDNVTISEIKEPSAAMKKAIEEAEALRAQAKALTAEANAMEIELKKSRSKQRNSKESETDEIIAFLFTENPTRAQSVADKLLKARYSPDLVLQVVNRLYKRQTEAINSSSTVVEFQIGSPNNVNKVNATEAQFLGDCLDTLIEAVTILDGSMASGDNTQNQRWTGRVEQAVRTRLKELQRADEATFQRKLASEINVVTNINTSVEDYVRRTLGKSLQGDVVKRELNISKVLERAALVPMWVPSSFLPFLLSSKAPTIGPEQVDKIKNDVLLGSRFYLTSSESVPGAAIFRGNIRSPLGGINSTDDRNHTAMVFDEIQNRMNRQGLSDTVQLFLMPDPQWRPNPDERELEPRPVLLALSKSVTPDEEKLQQTLFPKVVKTLSYPLSLITTFAYSISCYSLNPKFYESVVNQRDLTVLPTCIPVFLGVISIFLLQEATHYLMAKKKGIKIGPPVPLPSPQLGLFGSITPLRSFPSNREALFDFALSGPAASLVASLACVLGGIFASLRATPIDLVHFPVVPAALLKSSFLIGTFFSWFAPKVMMIPLAQPVPVHPLFVVGFSGLISSALNLLPLFRLDGGRACSAVMGPRQGALISVATLFFMLPHALSGTSGILLAWGLMIALFQRRAEIPARDEVTEVSNLRRGVWFFSFVLSLTILAPFPGASGIL